MEAQGVHMAASIMQEADLRQYQVQMIRQRPLTLRMKQLSSSTSKYRTSAFVEDSSK